jgi:thioredoxin reductase (NADPH)
MRGCGVVAEVERCVIVGSGCAGLTAAIYAARGRLEPLVLEGQEPGGQLALTSQVENFPGFPEGVGGVELTERMREQAARFGARFRDAVVVGANLGQRPFRLQLEGEEEPLATHCLIVAAGARARTLGLEGEKELWGRGLSSCATCDGAFFKGKRVAVVGGGDTAMEDALYLTKFAAEVHVVHRRGHLRASPIMQERARAHAKIHWHWNRVARAFLRGADGRLQGLRLATTDGDGAEELLPVDGVFYAIGHVPNTDWLGDAIPRDAQGYLTVHGVVSDIPGVFVAGDVADHRYQQAVTAAGTGCAAAMEAEDWLHAEGLVTG